MTDGNMVAAAVVGLAIVYWLWKHPTAAKGIGLVGLVCFGAAAHAQTHERRHHRSHRQRHRRRS
jgi:hypothetical protein